MVTISEEGVRNSPAKIVNSGSVLIVVRSGVLKHTLPVALAAVPLTVNQDVKALTPSARLDPSYLMHLIKSLEPEVLSWVRATTADNFPIEKLLDVKVNLPPLDEQRRIAYVLDGAAVRILKQQKTIDLIDELAPAYFESMFGSSTESLSLSHLAEFRYGTSNKSGPTGFPTLRIPNIVGGRIDPSDIKTVDVSSSESNRLSLLDGDLLFVRTNGNKDYVGRSAVFRRDEVSSAGFGESRWLFASYLIRARLDASLNPTFIATYLATRRGKRQLLGGATTSAGQFNINIDGLKSIKLPRVPLREQDAFGAIATSIRSRRQMAIKALASQELLFASLQAHAFRHKL